MILKTILLITLLITISFNAASACQSCDELNIENIHEQIVGMKNPAAVYCLELGYDYKVIQTERGEIGICIIPGTGEEFDAWEFFEGKCGQEYSYCACNGYDIKTMHDGKNPYSQDYAVCVHKDSTNASSVSSNGDMSVVNLMNLEQKIHVDLPDNTPSEELTTNTISIPSEEYATGIPNSFDWRNKDGKNWVTPVKNQGNCGSCWAFADVACLESSLNIALNNPHFDVDLSEEYLVSTCCPYGDCNGGYTASAIVYIMEHGITDEECFPYTASNSQCLGRCQNWENELYSFETAYDTYGCTDDQIKAILIDYGPMVTIMDIGGKGWVGDVMVCGGNLYGSHAVLLVGYNDIGEYWIIKNSWGASWNGDGYFKVRYGECNINKRSSPYLIVDPQVPIYKPNPGPIPSPIPIQPNVPIFEPKLIIPTPYQIITPILIQEPFLITPIPVQEPLIITIIEPLIVPNFYT